MKHIRLFEELNSGKPEIGDYVICIEKFDYVDTLAPSSNANVFYNFISTHVGKVVDVNSQSPYLVQYDDIPYNIKDWFENYGVINSRPFMTKEIIKFSKNREDLEAYINAKKYNL